MILYSFSLTINKNGTNGYQFITVAQHRGFFCAAVEASISIAKNTREDIQG
jgi:acetolactate synthase regulatory subunit